MNKIFENLINSFKYEPQKQYEFELANVSNEIDTYVSEIDGYLDQLQDANSEVAFKGEAVKAALTKFVDSVREVAKSYTAKLKAAEAAVGREHIKDSAPSLASEDFAVWGTEIPSFLYWVGSGNPGKENAPWHDPAFCMDPGYQETAVPVLCASALIDQ